MLYGASLDENGRSVSTSYFLYYFYNNSLYFKRLLCADIFFVFLSLSVDLCSVGLAVCLFTCLCVAFQFFYCFVFFLVFQVVFSASVLCLFFCVWRLCVRLCVSVRRPWTGRTLSPNDLRCGSSWAPLQWSWPSSSTWRRFSGSGGSGTTVS